ERPVNRRLNFYHSGDQSSSPRYHLSVLPPETNLVACSAGQVSSDVDAGTSWSLGQDNGFKEELVRAIYKAGNVQIQFEVSTLRLLGQQFLHSQADNPSAQLIRYLDLVASLRAVVYSSEFLVGSNEKKMLTDTQFQRELERQIKNKLNGGILEKLRARIQQEDTMQRQTLSAAQLREICFTCGLVMDDWLFREAILRLRDRGYGQYK
ncbi:hypothetical protein Ciccas_014343, partial [Cichlidogyrus casuarinus]